MNVSENICPVCKTKNEPEVIICGHCGAKLDDPFADWGPKTKTTDMEALTPEMIRDWSLQETREIVVPDRGISFYVEGRSNPAYIDAQGEVVLGRKSGTTSEMLLDLAPFGAYSLGVSRRHVVIRRAANGYIVLDLGSVNGTFLEEERLIPHRVYPLPNGAHLRLGRMQLFVLYQPFAETK